MTSRASMIEDIRSSLTKSLPFEDVYHHLQPSPQRSRRDISNFPPAELADRFCAELIAVGGEVHRTSNDKQALETIGKLLDELGAVRVAISELDLLRDPSFGSVELISDASRDVLFGVDAGISSAQLAIAETGTLVLRSLSERHRLVSLVPPIHICILNTKDIRAAMIDVLEEMSNQIDPAITFITGPSRTSDIELTLAIGVHGPKRLIVVLID